jgi:predicted Rossmann fold nucleotide-binding protein DprA/Smf involved in DNA uptake
MNDSPISLEQLFSEMDIQTKIKPQWYGITGSWKKTSGLVEEHVRESIRKVYERGDGIVSGGALSVDFFAADEALKLDPNAERMKIILPATLERYAAHYRKRAIEGVITSEQAEALVGQLEEIKHRNPAALVEHPTNTVIDPTTYFERNTAVVNASDAILGFQVNESEGSGDTIQKAIAQNKPVFVRKYIIE